MRRGAVQIPYEAFDRTIEYLDGAPDLGALKFRVHAYLLFHNLVSHIYRAYHFDSVREFLEYRDRLQEGVSRVAFQEVEVADRNDRDYTLELTLTDGTGEAILAYPYTLEIVEGHEMFPDSMNNPLHGAREGDKLQIFDSIYDGDNRILLPTEWYVKNDDHYRRMREIRDSLIRKLEEKTV
jgi:hypothetical protein